MEVHGPSMAGVMEWALALAPCSAGLLEVDAAPDAVALLACILQGQAPVAHGIVCSSFKCPCSPGNNHELATGYFYSLLLTHCTRL